MRSTHRAQVHIQMSGKEAQRLQELLEETLAWDNLDAEGGQFMDTFYDLLTPPGDQGEPVSPF